MSSRRISTFLVLAALLLLSSRAPAQPQPLTLRQAIASALEKNPKLRAAGFEAEAAAARVSQARAMRLPRVDFVQGITRGNNPIYVFGTLLTQRQFTAANFALARLNTPTPLDNFQTRFDAGWQLYDFGRTRNRVGGAQHLRTAQDFRTEQERQDLILRVIAAYQQWAIAIEQQAAARRAVESAEANQKRIETMEKAGLIVSSDMLSAQVHTAQMREREIRAANAVELARLNLQRETGADPGDAPMSAAKPSASPSGALNAGAYEEAAMKQRPLLRAAELEERAAQSGMRTARAEFLPRIEAFASFERDAETPSGPAGTNWTAGARVQFNLFAGGADRARLAEATAIEGQAKQQLEWLRSGIRLEVRQAFLETRAAEQRAAVMQASSAQAQESLRILEQRYQAGLANITDLLRAQVAALDSRTGYLGALMDWHIARAQLERAAGLLTPESALLKYPEEQ